MRLLTKAISALPDDDEAIVLGFLLARALVPGGSAPHASSPVRGEYTTVSLSGEPWRGEQTARWPRTAALLLLYQAAAGVAAEQVAAEVGLEIEVIHAIFDDLSRRLRRTEPLGAVFGELAQGRRLSQAAENLGRNPEDLASSLAPSETLIRAVAAAMARAALPRAPTPYVGYSPRGPLRTMPVRLPEEHYQRLKDWSEEHNFPMAVVVRGLVERFLDDQQPPRS